MRFLLLLTLSGVLLAADKGTIDWHDLATHKEADETLYLVQHKWKFYEGKGWKRHLSNKYFNLEDAVLEQMVRDTPICRWCIEDDMKGADSGWTLFGALHKKKKPL